jgi:hypothetical protein
MALNAPALRQFGRRLIGAEYLEVHPDLLGLVLPRREVAEMCLMREVHRLVDPHFGPPIPASAKDDEHQGKARGCQTTRHDRLLT